MASGASGSQYILTSSGWMTLKSLYNTYVHSGINIGIGYVEPTKFRDVKYRNINQVFNNGTQTGMLLTSEDGVTCAIPIDAYTLDMAEDYPPRPTIRHPSDAKCLVGPNIDSRTKFFVRKIVSREFVIINCYSLNVPNMIAKGGYVII